MGRKRPEAPPVVVEGAERARLKGLILDRLMGGPLTGGFLSGIVCGGVDLGALLPDLEAAGQLRSCCAGRPKRYGPGKKCPMGHGLRAGWRRAVWRLA